MDAEIKLIIPSLSRWPETKKLRIESIQNDPIAFATSLEEATTSPDEKWQVRLQDAHDRKNSIAYYAEINNKLIGTAALLLKHDKNQAVMIGVYVNPEHRGKGIAKLLLERLIAEAKLLNLEKIVLEVVATQTAAIKLYEKLGFTNIETKPDYFLNKNFPSVTVYEMELALN